MLNLKEVPTDQLLAELIDRGNTDECTSRTAFIQRLARYELVLMEESERNIRTGQPCNGHIEDTVVALAKLLMDY